MPLFSSTFKKHDEVKGFGEFLCDGYWLEGKITTSEFIDFYKEKCTAHPQHRLFSTLDDYHQAGYTSGHTTSFHDLDDIEGHDLSQIDKSAFENGEHVGYFSTPSEFPIRHKNFLKKAMAVEFESLGATRIWAQEAIKCPSFIAGEGALDQIFDQQIFIQIVPVPQACDALAAFPNGYFSSDLSPFANYATVKRFQDNYCCHLIGIGAAYMGFLPNAPITPDISAKLARDIDFLMAKEPGVSHAAVIEAALTGQSVFALKYTD